MINTKSVFHTRPRDLFPAYFFCWLMGCASSKSDDRPAVLLCRERFSFLNEALHQRYALAEAHVAYMESLKSVGDSLHHFFDAAGVTTSKGTDSPVLNLPPRGKGDPDEPTIPLSGAGHLSLSNSDSHHLLLSDSDDENSGSESLHHLHSPSALPHQDGIYQGPETLTPYPGIYMRMNYMKKQSTPSVSYEWRPMSPEKVQVGESSFYDPYYSGYQNLNSNHYNNSDGYMSYGGGGMGGFFGSLPPPPYGSPSHQVGSATPSSSTTPPPPTASGWDFLNPFESVDTNYPPYTPSRDSREVREEEGIPDLEDEDYQHEDVKEVYGAQKFVGTDNGNGSGGGSSGKNFTKGEDEEDLGVNKGVPLYRMRPTTSVEHDPVESEVHMVDKKVVGEGGSEEQENVGAFRVRRGFRNVSEVVKEIHVQFGRASASGSELAEMLEVGKLLYKRKNAAFQVSSKILHSITPSLPSTAKDIQASSSAQDLDEVVGSRSGNLSSTMQKLHLWEKKLLEEVKAEENMRVIHDRKLQKLRRLDERGAEADKVDTTRTLVRNLSTKIRIAIQVVDKISVKINKLRDEELWPQLNELIQGFARMLKAMLQCHHSQREAVDGISFPRNPSDSHLEATMQLEHDLINWTLRFSNWVGAQKCYVRALNSWLLKCLLYEPEETPDGIAPFSPGRAGAPPVFVICNQWSQALERISEKEVIDSMRCFAMTLSQFRERDKAVMQQRMKATKDMETKVKNLEREDMKIQKKIQALDKTMAKLSVDTNGLSASGHVVYQSDTSSKSNLQGRLQHVFEAVYRFMAESVKAYEELLQRSEEVVRGHGRVS
ncbi:hypothetical protein Nepgr_019971 [Nepenthes gracilis]|uniref:Uncharacterized protein n=1 Tax=Nepenthes gracilis TaxID=150966 RepID=A0AAD3SVY6_NEPGR|nr:hypothetical protein Nepgr_019971 [Nepenthes gracilis]